MKRAVFLLFFGASSVLGQSQNTPVRRAEAVGPVPSPTPSWPTDINSLDNPAWMQKLPPSSVAKPTPGADRSPEVSGTPYRPSGQQPASVSSPADSGNKAAPRVSSPAAPPVVVPSGPVPQQVPATPPPQPQGGGAVPVAKALPANPEGGQSPRVITSKKDYADSFYSRKMYDLAVPEYERFLSETPQSPERASAWFRLAESYRNLKNLQESRAAYERLLRESKKGEFAGAAAYRLGGMQMEEKLYSGAASNFEIAATEAHDPSVRLSAAFFAARCFDSLGDKRQALRFFEKVSKEGKGDPRYEEYSLAATARLSAELGNKAAALAAYEQLAQTTGNQDVKSESRLKVAQILLEENRVEEARSVLDSLAAKKDSPKAVALARNGLLEIDYQAKNYAGVAAFPVADVGLFVESARPGATLMIANANRQLEKYAEALALYDQILKKYPGTPAAKEARFNRLVCLFRRGDPALMESLNRFLKEAQDKQELDQARLLKAETHFKAEQWAEAAEVYGALSGAKLPEAMQADASFKHAWCLAKIGQPQKAVVAYSDFINRFPKSELLPNAFVGRGMAHLENGATDAAMRDFDNVLQKYPGSKEREIALLQRALSFGTRRDYAKMRADFETLIQQYPDSAARAQAEFWVGYSKFEEKDYQGSLPHFEEARRRDPEAYNARASLRAMLANYYLEKPEETALELEKNQLSNIPSEVYQWLAAKFLEAGELGKGEKYLKLVLDGQAGNAASPELFLQLAQCRVMQKKYEEAQEPLTRYLDAVREPVPRAKGFMAQAEAFMGAGDLDKAQKAVEDAQLLQPEGRINAEARLLSGKIQMARKQYAEAAKVFMTLAVLYDDDALTPEALRLAAEAYRKSSNPADADKALDELRRRYPNSAVSSEKISQEKK